MTNDKTLMIVAVIAVIVSVLGLIFSWMTMGSFDDWRVGLSPGLTTNQSIGIVNVTIIQNLVVNFSIDKIQWGRGYVAAGQPNATLDSASSVLATRGCWNRTNTIVGSDGCGLGDGVLVPTGFLLQNIGNINATIYLKTDQNAAQFIGGSLSGPNYMFNVTNSEAGSCLNRSNLVAQANLGIYRDVNTTHPGTEICGLIPFGTPGGPEANTIRIDVLLTIPANAPTSFTPKISNMSVTAEVVVP